MVHMLQAAKSNQQKLMTLPSATEGPYMHTFVARRDRVT